MYLGLGEKIVSGVMELDVVPQRGVLLRVFKTLCLTN
jgi:hypothetical protein